MKSTPRGQRESQTILEELVPEASIHLQGAKVSTVVERKGVIYKITVERMDTQSQKTFQRMRGVRT